MGSAVISKRAMIGNGYCHSRVLIVAGRLWHGRLCQWRRPIAIAHFDEGRRHAAWGLPMSSIARDARLKVAEYEKRAATAHDPETRRHYIQLARDWQDLARGRANSWRQTLEFWRERKISGLDSLGAVSIKHPCRCVMSVPPACTLESAKQTPREGRRP